MYAYQLSPYPNFLGPIAESVAHIKHRHALELAREVARALHTTGQLAAEQAQLNWSTVQQSYGQDQHNADRARNRLAAMAKIEKEKERTCLQTRRELHLANPVLEQDLCRNLIGESVAIPNNRRDRQPKAPA